MQLVSNNSELKKTIKACIQNHAQIAFATAWASAGTEIFKILLKNKRKIWRAIIGTHFYQTDPDVLNSFVGYDKVHFKLQTSGVFHPKIYIFWTGDYYEMLIGSANLTHGALYANDEIMLHITSQDCNGDNDIFYNAKLEIDNFYNSSIVMNRDFSDNYKQIWSRYKRSRNILASDYGVSTKSKNPCEIKLMSMTWNQFYDEVNIKDVHNVQKRCSLMEYANNKFTNSTFYRMDEQLRRALAGCIENYDGHVWGWFGSIKQGKFPGIIKDNNQHISDALDLIPSIGNIDKNDFMMYINEFIRAFPSGGHALAVVTRLITLKRPDYFVCLNKKNKERIYKEFGIPSIDDHDYEGYWDKIIERIINSVWWGDKQPSDVQQKRVWNVRAAMIDALTYNP